MILDSTLAFGFRSSTTTSFGCSASFILTSYRPWWNSACTPTLSARPNLLNSNRIRTAGSAAEFSSSASHPSEVNGKPSTYHPFEEIEEPVSIDRDHAELTPAEIARTLIEVNNKATLMFSGLVDDQLQENIFWPDLPYLTDEYGNVYFAVNTDEDILRTLTTENNYVQVIIGLDTKEMQEMELGTADIDFGFENITEEASNDEEDEDDDSSDDETDDYDDKEWVGIFEDDLGPDAAVGDWAKLETMRSSHPMSFARKLTEVASDEPVDCMDQPSAGLAIQALLQPAIFEEHSRIRKHMAEHQCSDEGTLHGEKVAEDSSKGLHINGHDHKWDSRPSSEDGSLSEEMETDESQITGSTFYKLEMVKIQLVSPQGSQTLVELKDFKKAQPDAIAHTAAKVISRLKAGGEKTAQALESLCWRVKGIQVEEVILVGIDSLGIDLRVCAGTQVQNLRFAFATRATSEYSAERQLHDLMFPRLHYKMHDRQEAQPK